MNKPNHIKKSPKYKGCLTMEYIPLVFKKSAICFSVFLPDIPFGMKLLYLNRKFPLFQIHRLKRHYSNLLKTIVCEISTKIIS